MFCKTIAFYSFFFPLTLHAQIHLIGQVKDNKGLPVKNVSVVFGNSTQKCLSDMYGVVECDLNYVGGEEVSIRIEPTDYLLSIDNPIIIKKSYDANPLKIAVVRKGSEIIKSTSENSNVLPYINNLTKIFIENADDRLVQERIQSKSISDAVSNRLISLNQLAHMKTEAAYAGIAYYIIEHPEIKYINYLTSSYNFILRNFTRLAYANALIEVVKGKSSDSLQIFSKDIEPIVKVFDEEGGNFVKEKCLELKDYVGLNEGWNEGCKCYRFNESNIRFHLVNRNVTDGAFMKPYFISEPLKGEVLLQFLNLNNGAYPHIAVLRPNKLLDSLHWRNYQSLAEVLKGLSIPTFFEIVNADLVGAIELKDSCVVFTNCQMKSEEGEIVWPLCFIEKTVASYDSLMQSRYLSSWTKEFELRKNNFNYYGIRIDPSSLRYQPIDGTTTGRDFYDGPFFFVRKASLKHLPVNAPKVAEILKYLGEIRSRLAQIRKFFILINLPENRQQQSYFSNGIRSTFNGAKGWYQPTYKEFEEMPLLTLVQWFKINKIDNPYTEKLMDAVRNEELLEPGGIYASAKTGDFIQLLKSFLQEFDDYNF